MLNLFPKFSQVLSKLWPIKFSDGKLKGFKKQSLNPNAEKTFNGVELCQDQIMASISYFGFTGNVESPEDNFEGFFEESSGWATISNWLERQVEILNNSVRMKCSAFDHISNEIRHFSLQIAPRKFLTFQHHTEMDFKLNGYIFEPEQTTILPNEFVKLHLSHLWTKNFRHIASYRDSFLYSIVQLMIKGLVW